MKIVKQVNRVLLFGIFLLFYITVFFYVLFFKNIPPSEVFSANREYIRDINLIPFRTISSYLVGFNPIIAGTNLLGNIILFVPLGLYLSIFAKNKKMWKSLLTVFFISLSVELLQFIFGLGTADIDDILLNSLGGLLGMLVYKGLYTLLKDEEKVHTAIVILCIVFILTPLFIVNLLGLKLRLV